MIEVRIRHIDGVSIVIDNDFMPDDFDDLVKAVKNYGCYDGGNMCQFLSAQFVADPEMTTKAFFEIVVENEGE